MKFIIFIFKRFLTYFYYWLREILFNIPPPRVYRRRIGGPAWHFLASCKYWPSKNFEEHIGHPEHGVCPDCVRQETENMKYIDQDSP